MKYYDYENNIIKLTLKNSLKNPATTRVAKITTTQRMLMRSRFLDAHVLLGGFVACMGFLNLPRFNTP